MRIATALVGIPIVVGLTWLGGWPFAAMIVAIALIAQGELYGLGSTRVPWSAAVPAFGAGVAATLFAVGPAAPLTALLLLLAAFVAVPLKGDTEDAFPTAAVTALGVVYPPLMLGTLIAIRWTAFADLDGFWITLGIIVLVWAADTGAYYAGRRFGRRLLAPVVSPKKTWEGFAGGVVAAVATAALWSELTGSGLALAHWIALAVVASVLGPMGDLFESSLKRSAGVKDSGSWLPGHGGMLDRFDALSFVAPVSWLYLMYVAGA